MALPHARVWSAARFFVREVVSSTSLTAMPRCAPFSRMEFSSSFPCLAQDVYSPWSFRSGEAHERSKNKMAPISFPGRSGEQMFFDMVWYVSMCGATSGPCRNHAARSASKGMFDMMWFQSVCGTTSEPCRNHTAVRQVKSLLWFSLRQTLIF